MAYSSKKHIKTKKPWALTANRFICFIDIMGFKNMVMRNSHAEIYKLLLTLSKLRTIAEEEFSFDNQKDSLKSVSFSDSIIIFTKDDSIDCFEAITSASNFLFSKAMEFEIPMKGALAHGELSINITSQVFFGQPLIDAYLLEEEIAFYGIVVHDTLEKFLNNNSLEIEAEFLGLYIECSAHFKSGKINHIMLNWLNFLKPQAGLSKRDIALSLMKKQREKTSGGPRKYIDNTISIINEME
ncbi:MAG: hypothetical protein FD166_1435 [Bacteroidetes bacterium]|nr:MAG: hypothetical protein FD166_1435 [Bacteroidota bacterium]